MDVRAEQESSGDAVTSANLEALRSEMAELRARLGSYEKVLQIRDAALSAGSMPSLVASEPSRPNPDLPPTFIITADQLLPAQDGFYQLEWGPEGAFRWTGPGDAVHFETWIDRSAPPHRHRPSLSLRHARQHEGTDGGSRRPTLCPAARG